MAMRPLIPAWKGAANNSPFANTPPGFAPVDALLNAVPVDATDRTRMSQREGFRRLHPSAMSGGAAVQELCGLTRASQVTSSDIGDGQVITAGSTRETGTLAGGLWMLDQVPSLCGYWALDVSDDVGPTSVPVNAAAAHPTLARVAYAANYDSGGLGHSRLAVRDLDTGEDIWTATIEEAGKARFVNTLCYSPDGTYIFVATNEWVYMYDAETGELTDQNDCEGWSSEVVEVSCLEIDGVDYVLAAFNGADAVGTYENLGDSANGSGTIEAGNPAVHFRTGIMKFVVNPAESLYPHTINRVTYGGQLTSDQAFFETTDGNTNPHGYWRVSEHSAVPWHGCLITAMRACQATGEVFFARTNQGWGPNSALTGLGGFQPDSTLFPRITVTAINADGSIKWEADVGSIVEAGEPAGTMLNDIPIWGDSTPDPTLSALAVDANGDVYVGGRKTAAGWSVHKLSGTNGFISPFGQTHMTTATGSIRQACMAIDPSDGNLVLGGDRGTDWTGASAANAHLWKLNAESLEVMWSWDLGASVSALAVAVVPDGRVVFGTDVV